MGFLNKTAAYQHIRTPVGRVSEHQRISEEAQSECVDGNQAGFCPDHSQKTLRQFISRPLLQDILQRNSETRTFAFISLMAMPFSSILTWLMAYRRK
jgi:hypothetical protein